MTRAVPKEIREKIVKCYEQEMLTIEEIMDLFDISARSIFRYVFLARQKLSLAPKPYPGSPAILTERNLQLIKDIISSKTDGTLQEYANSFKEKTGIEVTFVTIHNACKKMNLRFKKKVSMLKKKID